MNYFTYHKKKQVVALLLWVAFLGLTQACKQNQEVDPGFGPDGEPRILAVKIPEIPDQNIYVDQAAKQVVVTVPTSYSARYITPTLTLTPSTTVISGQYSLNVVDDASQYPIALLTTGNKQNKYILVLKPAGELTFGAVSGPQTYSVTDQTVYVQLPVYNYIDGAGYQTSKVTLINQTTGDRVVPTFTAATREGVGDPMPVPRTDGAVVLTLYLNGNSMYYQPGQYTVELTKPNGRKATLARPIQLLRGATKANFNANYTLQLNSGEYLLYGSNYYRDDKVSLRLQGPNQQAITIDALGFIDKQPGIRLPTALNLKPGYYYAQLIVNGVATSSTGRMTISDQAKPLLIETLSAPGQTPSTSLIGVSYSFDTPITLTKGGGYYISTNYFLLTPNDAKATRRVRLTRLTDRTRVYDMPLEADPSRGIDLFRIPDTIPGGQYELTVQVVRSDGSVIDGLPLERTVVVQ